MTENNPCRDLEWREPRVISGGRKSLDSRCGKYQIIGQGVGGRKIKYTVICGLDDVVGAYYCPNEAKEKASEHRRVNG